MCFATKTTVLAAWQRFSPRLESSYAASMPTDKYLKYNDKNEYLWLAKPCRPCLIGQLRPGMTGIFCTFVANAGYRLTRKMGVAMTQCFPVKNPGNRPDCDPMVCLGFSAYCMFYGYYISWNLGDFTLG